MLFVIVALRTSYGKERMALEALETRVKVSKLPIKAIFAAGELKGYIFVEADKREDIEKSIRGLPHVRGIIEKEVKTEDVEKFMSKQEEKKINFNQGDIVEVIGGPFKKEKAKIVSIDETKYEAKIQLIDSTVPIAITIKLDLLRPVAE